MGGVVATQTDDYLSASKIGKQLGVKTHYVTTLFERCGWIAKQGDHWEITPGGEQTGAKYMESPRFGRWIAWPASVMDEVRKHADELRPTDKDSSKPAKSLTATGLGKQFHISATRVNHILSELGWITKSVKGWAISKQGEAVGGSQREDFRSGVPYAVWPEAILENTALQSTFAQQLGESAGEAVQADTTDNSKPKDFRKKYEAAHRATDGHYVRSKAEMLIDNWLYMAEIVHAYERKLPVEEDVYSDFYIPAGKIYIEFWGLENDPHYDKRKKVKQGIYQKYGFNLIELTDHEVQNLDDALPRQLLKFGVQAY